MPDPYASHVRPLRALLIAERPRRVLEYGGGEYSTGLFLSFGHLERLVTVEADEDWRTRLTSMFSDRRHRIVSSGNPSPDDFDLIFIDDGTSAAQRTQTIRAVLSAPHPTVVIHDAEVYAPVIDEYTQVYEVFPTGPDTAVITATN